MAYDPALGQIVLFGGQGPDWPDYDDTWLFDGDRWTPGPAAPKALDGRTGARMEYLPEIGKLVLFGGSGVVPHNSREGSNTTTGATRMTPVPHTTTRRWWT